MRTANFQNILTNGSLKFKAGNFSWMQLSYTKALSNLISSNINYSYFTAQSGGYKFFILDGFEVAGGQLTAGAVAVVTVDPVSNQLIYEICEYAGGQGWNQSLDNYWIYTEVSQQTSNINGIEYDPQQFNNVQNGIFHTNKVIRISATDPGPSITEKTTFANVLDMRNNGITYLADSSNVIDLATMQSPVCYREIGTYQSYTIRRDNSLANIYYMPFKKMKLIMFNNGTPSITFNIADSSFAFSNSSATFNLASSFGTVIFPTLELDIYTEISQFKRSSAPNNVYGFFNYSILTP